MSGKGPKFTILEERCLLAWLKINNEKYSTKIALAKALHAYLVNRNVSPLGVKRSLGSIRRRLPQLEKDTQNGK